MPGLNACLCLFQIDRQQFEETVRTLNNLYAEAEKLGSQSYLEGCLACLTAYTIFLCMETHYEKVHWPLSGFLGRRPNLLIRALFLKGSQVWLLEAKRTKVLTYLKNEVFFFSVQRNELCA